MDILVCQSCGAFIRGRAKFCTGCGAYVTKFSPTSLPIVAQSSLPLVVALSPDPLVLEKALVEQKFQLYNGAHGGNGGNGSHDDKGGNGDYQSMSPEPASYGTSTPPIQSAPVQEPNFAAEAEASFASSQFSSIIGSAGTGKPTSRTADAQKIFDLLGQEAEPEPEPVIPEPVIPEPAPTEEYSGVSNQAMPPVSIQPFHPGSLINDQDFAADIQPAAPNSIPGIPVAQEPQPTAQVPPAIPAPQAQPPASVPSFSPMAPASPSGGFSAVPTAPSMQPSKSFDLFDPAPVEPTPEAPKPAESTPNPFTKESFEPSPGIPMPPAWGSDTSSAESTNTTSKAVDSVISKDDSATQAQQVRGLLARRASNKAKHDLEDEPEPQAGKPAPWKMLTEPVEIAGRSVPKGALLVVGLVVLFFGFRLLGPVTGLVGGAFGDLFANLTMQNGPSISGDWTNRYQYDKKIAGGKFHIDQSGTKISGSGRDPDSYVLTGTYRPPNITFYKKYLNADGTEQNGKPVACTGKVEISENSLPTMAGTYTKQVGIGTFIHRRIVNIEGPWDARMVRETAPVDSGIPLPTFPGDTGEPESGVEGPRNFFMKIALGIVVFCVLLAMLSLKVFGPSGLLNIWGKKEFIPSQFKSQHNKMLKEMGKPIAKGGLPLGKRLDWNILQFDKPQNLALPPSMRESNPHILVMGAGQKGKTRLMANMITSDILSGDRAVVVIDSDGSLVDLVVNWIAAHPKGAKLAERVIIMDPTHKGGCPAYNPLEMPENGDMQGAASAVVFGFKAIYTEPPGSQSQWNQQTANIVRNSALLLMANGKTLTDMEKLLSSDNDFRDVLLEKIERQKNERVEYNTLLQQWDNYKRLARSDQWITWTEPIRNRIAATLSDPRIQPILTKAKGDLNLVDVVNQKKVLLVKVPQSAFDDNANLLGSLIVTGLKQATLSGLPGKSAKRPSVLYLDEFDNFIEKDTIDTITSETKTFQIGLIGACKTLQHLPEDSRNQLAIHMGTICAFSLAKKDADMLGPQMFRVDGRKIKHQTIQNVFNKVNTTPQFELISDEEKLNIDRVVGQEERTFFCYKVGTVAGVFHLKAPDFKDVPEKDINWALVEQMYGKA